MLSSCKSSNEEHTLKSEADTPARNPVEFCVVVLDVERLLMLVEAPVVLQQLIVGPKIEGYH